MIDDFEIRITDQQDSEEYNLVLAALRDYNASHLKRDIRELTITIFDDSKALAAGLNGATYWGWLFVEHLWVREDCRKSGLGKELITLAETEAKSRGCRHAYLDTFSFQAPEFYKKLGYIEYAKFDDFPGNHSRHFLKKDFA
jgi:GNAT superfamily N-acetyltransferase